MSLQGKVHSMSLPKIPTRQASDTRVYARGVGANTLALDILQKCYYLRKGDQLFLYIVCLVICRLHANTTEWICMQISRNIVNGQKVMIWFLWESGLSSASRNHLTTFCRHFAHYACFRLCPAIVHCIRNNCVYFICYGWSAQALTALATLPISVAW